MDIGHVGTEGGLAGTPHLASCICAGGFKHSNPPKTGLMIGCNLCLCVFQHVPKVVVYHKEEFSTTKNLLVCIQHPQYLCFFNDPNTSF